MAKGGYRQNIALLFHDYHLKNNLIWEKI